MDFIAYIILFAFGLVIGSFLNVVILRFNTGMSIQKGRSACFTCGKSLSWHELVPLLSFVIQRGACRGCKSKISWQYPLVELAGGAAFVIAYMRIPEAFSAPTLLSLAAFALTATLLCLYIVIAAYDARHKIIPDAFSYAAALAALGLIGLGWAMTGHIDMYQIIAGPCMFIFFWAFWFFSKGTWMGLGDGKLALSIGWALGLSSGIASLLLSFWIGAIVSLALIGFQKLSRGKGKLGMKSQIPFGPFLLIGFLIAFIWNVDMSAILSHLAL